MVTDSYARRRHGRVVGIVGGVSEGAGGIARGERRREELKPRRWDEAGYSATATRSDKSLGGGEDA